jgi:hypothetical protein
MIAFEDLSQLVGGVALLQLVDELLPLPYSALINIQY